MSFGLLEVRFASHADGLLERLAAEHRAAEAVFLVSSDRDIRETVGQAVRKRSSADFVRELASEPASPPGSRTQRFQVEDALDETTRARLERWRRRRA